MGGVRRMTEGLQKGGEAADGANAREAAMGKILEVISRSRADEKPVFDVILENAARLCRSTMARLHLLNEESTHHLLAAHWGEAMHTSARMPWSA